MAILIILLLALLIFAFVVTRPNGAHSVPGRAYDEYRLLGSLIGCRITWQIIGVKSGGASVSLAFALSLPWIMLPLISSSRHNISPLQSGCCKPPMACGYSYINPTVWINPMNPRGDPDCYAWSNDQSQLCYRCSSCRAGPLGNLRKEWRRVNVVLIVTVVVLVWVYVIPCSAFKNAQTEDLFRHYKEGYT